MSVRIAEERNKKCPALRSVVVALALFASTSAACSTGGTGDPASKANDGGVLCTQSTKYGCCNLFPACVDHWTEARVCAAWPASQAPTLHETPCDGFVALSFGPSNELRLYDVTSGELSAIVETGTPTQCALGPSVLAVSPACIATWAATSTPCATEALYAPPSVLCAPFDAGPDAPVDPGDPIDDPSN